jgi:hypothetical protein
MSLKCIEVMYIGHGGVTFMTTVPKSNPMQAWNWPVYRPASRDAGWGGDPRAWRPLEGLAGLWQPLSGAVQQHHGQGMARKSGKTMKTTSAVKPEVTANSDADFSLDDLPVVESKCRSGTKWSIKDESEDIVRELEARRDGKVWSGCMAPNGTDLKPEGYEGAAETQRRKDQRRYALESGVLWDMVIKRLSAEVHKKLGDALQKEQLREAIGVVAEAAFMLGVDAGPKIRGARGLRDHHDWKLLGIVLTAAEYYEMTWKEAYDLLRKGGELSFPPAYIESPFPSVPHHIAVLLLEGWPNRGRAKRRRRGTSVQTPAK